MPLRMATDPEIAAYAWMRFRRVMRWLMAATVALVVVALRLAASHAGYAAIRRYVVAALLAGAVMLVGSGLMGIKYLARNLRGKRPGAGENPPPGPRRPGAPE